jgi:hypothetical protein
MSDARNMMEMEQQSEEKTLSNPMDNLVEDANRIAKFFAEVDNKQCLAIVMDTLNEYEKPLVRYLLSRRTEIEKVLKELGYDIKSANPISPNAKPFKEVFAALTVTGGKEDSSFNTIFIRMIVKSLQAYDPDVKLSEVQCDRLKQLIHVAVETRLHYQNQINEQEIQLKQAQENRLREEESLLKTQLESSKCKTALLELMAEKSDKRLELVELDEEKRERERQLNEYHEKLQKIAREELEKSAKLEKIKEEENKKRIELESIKNELEMTRKKYACVHPDFDIAGLTLEQLERVRKTREQATMFGIASERGKVEKDEELALMNAKKVRAKEMQEKMSEASVDEEVEKAKLLRQEEIKQLFEKRRTEVTAEVMDNLKKQLELCLRLGQNKAEQKQVEEDKREILLEKDGFLATVHDAPTICLPQEDYANNSQADAGNSQEKMNRKLEKKPVAKSFKEMKMKQGMQSKNEHVNKAFSKLSLFFGNNKAADVPVVQNEPSAGFNL